MKPKSAGKSGRKSGKLHWSLNCCNWAFLMAGVVIAAVFYKSNGQWPWPNRPVPHVAEPWGELVATPIELERPEEFLSLDLPAPRVTRWFFGKRNPEQVVAFLGSCGFSVEQLRRLQPSFEQTVSGTWLTPPAEWIPVIEPPTRERIYRELARFSENPAHRYPYYCKDSTFEEWFSGCELPADKLQLIETLTYTRGSLLCFSDAEYLQRHFSPEEMRNASRRLSRTRTLFLKLSITPTTDLDALLGYWGTNLRERSVRPLLESLKRLPEGGSLNVSWFFPPVPRLLLYSYPQATNVVAGKFPDCLWTSLNFFKETPDPRMFDDAAVDQVLKTEYRLVPKAGLFGDLILLFERDGPDIVTVHMCVFVADNIVFTKNGYDPRKPWVLMPLDEVMMTYVSDPTASRVEVAVFRRLRR